MKNILKHSNGSQTLLSNVNDGTNRIFINDDEIPSSSWVGTGTYTITIDGVTVSIAKISDLSGNIMLQKVSDNAYQLVRYADIDTNDYDIGISGTDLTLYEDGEPKTTVTVPPKGDKGDKGDTGDTGAKGDKGDTGDDGEDGVSVQSVTQTVTSSADHGLNIVTVTLSNGQVSTFQFYNGNKGSTGAKGDKGDTFTYDDLTAAQIAELKQDVSTYYKKSESSYTTTADGETTIPINISGFRTTDILIVDINGLTLIQDTEYTISGTNIVLTATTLPADTVIHFVALRTVEVTAQDYSNLKGDTGNGFIYYGTCTTAAATQAKVATVDSGFILSQGAMIAIKFTNNNSYSATATNPITLNVNSTGAKNIYYANSSTPTGTNTTAFGRANYINYYLYDGTYWVWVGSSADNNTTYSVMSKDEATTGTATASRVMRADYLKAAILELSNPIGTVIESTTCDTMAKVVAAYGGTTWIQHSGYVLRGASSGVVANSASSDGGSDSVSYTPSGSNSGGSVTNTTLTSTAQIPAHTHGSKTLEGSFRFLGWKGSSSPYNSATSGIVSVSSNNVLDRTASSGSNLGSQTNKITATHEHSSVGGTTAHGHGFTNPTFSGTASTINTLPEYKSVYIWERTA